MSIIILAILSLCVFTIIAARTEGEKQRKNETIIVEKLLEEISNRLIEVAQSNAVRNEAFEHLVVTHSASFAKESLTDQITDTPYIEAALIVYDGGIVLESESHIDLPATLWSDGLVHHFEPLRSAPFGQTSNSSHPITSNGRIFMMGASLVTATNPEKYPGAEDLSRPMIVLLRELTTEGLEALGAAYTINQLSVSSSITVDPKSGFVLTDVLGEPVGTVRWTSPNLSIEFFKSILLPFLVVLIIVTGLLYWISTRSCRLFLKIDKSRAAAEAANAAKSQFFASMTHELRTPLNAILGFSQLLQLDFLECMNKEQKQYVDLIHDSGVHLLSLVNDVLDLGKLEAEKMKLHIAALQPDNLLGRVTSTFELICRDKNLSLDLMIDPAVTQVHADRRAFRQILTNLIANAVKYTPKVEESMFRLRKMTRAISGCQSRILAWALNRTRKRSCLLIFTRSIQNVMRTWAAQAWVWH